VIGRGEERRGEARKCDFFKECTSKNEGETWEVTLRWGTGCEDRRCIQLVQNHIQWQASLLARPRAHKGNWQPQRNRNFRELLLAWVEHMLLNGATHTEETALPFPQFALLHSVNCVQLRLITILWCAVALRLPVSSLCPRPKVFVARVSVS
jgi:hypothetical protein